MEVEREGAGAGVEGETFQRGGRQGSVLGCVAWPWVVCVGGIDGSEQPRGSPGHLSGARAGLCERFNRSSSLSTLTGADGASQYCEMKQQSRLDYQLTWRGSSRLSERQWLDMTELKLNLAITARERFWCCERKVPWKSTLVITGFKISQLLLRLLCQRARQGDGGRERPGTGCLVTLLRAHLLPITPRVPPFY